MGSAISVGTTGLTASSKQMDIIGNNLANSNTLGFKAGSATFSSMLNQSLSSSGSMAVGQGVQVSGISTQFAQGSFESTGNATDLAIDGEGFFVVNDVNGAAFYTRVGGFHVNNEGLLVDANSYKLQGYSTTQGTTATVGTDTAEKKIQDISFSAAQSNANATSTMSIGANLNESMAAGDKFNIAQTVYDSKGGSHNLAIVFQKTEGSGIWGFNATLDDTNISDVTQQEACGLTFDADGALLGMYSSSIPSSGTGFPTPAPGSSTTTVGTILSTTITKPGQLYQSATGITLTKGSTTGSWDVTTPAGYDNAISWQETVGANEILKVDLDGNGGSDIAFNLGISKEVATVTFAGPLAAGNTVTIAGRIFTATGAATAAQVATAFAGGTAVLGTMSGTLTGYTAAAGTAAGTTVFTSTAIGNVSNLTAAVVGAPAPTIVAVDANNWVAGNTVTFGITKSDVTLANVSLTFGPLSDNPSGTPPTIGATSGTGASATNKIMWDLIGTTAKTMTSYASSSMIQSQTNDGYGKGILKSVGVESDGVISGFFTNGQTAQLGQIVLASFRDNSGLRNIGNYYGSTISSGEAVINPAASEGVGEIRSNSLELSNVDVAKEFINMITAQRAYQASSRVITTADQMLTELMNIKR